MLTENAATATLSANCVLTRSAHCSIRPQGEQYLIYNSQTDELHLISPIASYVLELCNGLNSVGDLSQMFAHTMLEEEQVVLQLSNFLLQLVDRGVLEVTEP